MAFWKTGRYDPAAGRRNDFAHIKPHYHTFAKKTCLFGSTEIRQSADGFLCFPPTDVKLSRFRLRSQSKMADGFKVGVTSEP